MKRRFFKLLRSLPFVSKTQDAVLPQTGISSAPQAERTKSNIQASVFPFDIEACHGAKAYARWKAIKSENVYYPVIVGTDRELAYLSENYEVNSGVTGDRPAAQGYDFPDGYIRQQEAEMAEFYDDDDEITDFQQTVSNIIENWDDEPFEQSQTEPSVVSNHDGQYHDRVYIALLPNNDWTLIPSLMRFGGWNACPQNEWHVSAFRYWHKKYGAELVSLTHDTVEMRVKHRPELLEDAVRLAVEQYFYCNDIVDQGVGDPALLAKFLMQSNFWYFWWD